jgi:iron complex outermembrane receptor protein
MPAQIAGAQALEEIIVTARKREESLQDVPISVQAFSGEEITEQGIVDLQMLAPYTPSFSYTPSPGASDLYFMRGLGTFGSGVHFEPGVGQVFNGFFSTRGRLGRSALVDVAQVEILKGPQGAIIGKNTSLGAINITTNKPTD